MEPNDEPTPRVPACAAASVRSGLTESATWADHLPLDELLDFGNLLASDDEFLAEALRRAAGFAEAGEPVPERLARWLVKVLPLPVAKRGSALPVPALRRRGRKRGSATHDPLAPALYAVMCHRQLHGSPVTLRALADLLNAPPRGADGKPVASPLPVTYDQLRDALVRASGQDRKPGSRADLGPLLAARGSVDAAMLDFDDLTRDVSPEDARMIRAMRQVREVFDRGDAARLTEVARTPVALRRGDGERLVSIGYALDAQQPRPGSEPRATSGAVSARVRRKAGGATARRAGALTSQERAIEDAMGIRPPAERGKPTRA